MTVDENKALARQFYEALNAGRSERLDDLVAKDFVEHGAAGEETRGLDAFKEFLRMVTGAFPDLQIHVDDMLGEGNKVAVRLTVRATHRGVLMDRIQPTGRPAVWTGIDILEIGAGKIVGRWSERNLFGLMQQLGVQ